MKLKPEQKGWYKAQAEQYVTPNEPAFLWRVNMKMAPLVNVAGRDLYINGKGEMVIKIASLLPVVNVHNNKKTNQSILQRFLLELPMYPTAALNPYITWEGIDEYTSKATLTYKGVSGSASFHFSEDGDLEKVSAFRFKENDEKAELVECIGELKETTQIDGMRIPTKMDISWMLGQGKFTWYKLEIFDVKINEE